jgi:hypothetical protein
MPKSHSRRQPRRRAKARPGGNPGARAATPDQDQADDISEVVSHLAHLHDDNLGADALSQDAGTFAASRTALLAAESGATTGQLDAIAADIPARVDALLSRWEHPEQVWPLLAMAHEEAWHYQPSAVALIARAATVAAVRNSALESAHSARHLPDDSLALITGTTALRMAHGLPQVGNRVPPAPDGPRGTGERQLDPFAGLASQFPAAWQAFEVLAHLQRWDQDASAGSRAAPERAYDQVSAEPVRLGDLAAPGGRDSGNGKGWVLDGMAGGVGPDWSPTLTTTTSSRARLTVEDATDHLMTLARGMNPPWPTPPNTRKSPQRSLPTC